MKSRRVCIAIQGQAFKSRVPEFGKRLRGRFAEISQELYHNNPHQNQFNYAIEFKVSGFKSPSQSAKGVSAGIGRIRKSFPLDPS